MRRILGYVDGKAIWSDNTPGAYARVPGHSGSMVSGERGVVQRHREAKRDSYHRGRTVDSSWTELGDKSLEAHPRNPQNRGVKPTTPEVPTVSVVR